MDYDEIDELKGRRICIDCIGEPHLVAIAAKLNEVETCDYCEAENAATMAIEELATEIEGAFDRHYVQTNTEPEGIEYALSKEGLWSRHGHPVAEVIAEAACIGETAAEHVRQVLEYEHADMERDQMGEEGPFDDDAHYEEAEINDQLFVSDWDLFEQSLRAETRYFNSRAKAVLDKLFEGIGEARSRIGAPVIRTCGPGTALAKLYRARVFQSERMLEQAIRFPSREISAPPSAHAASGRMNAKGISTFYGATAPAISIAEVRPPVGSRVAIGCFDIIRPVRLLDVAAFEELLVEGSIFDPSYAPKLERARFLRRLSERITMPVMPEEEGERHLVTQAMADYLAGEENLKLDGILYRSAQSDVSGHNVVLFHNAARCDAIDLPRGTEVTGQTGMHTEDGYETDYCVWEEVPVDTKASEKEDWIPRIHLPPLFGDRTEDSRSMTLRLDAQSLMVHHVSAVSFKTETFEVRRHRFEKRDRPKF